MIQTGKPTKIGTYIVYGDAGNDQWPRMDLLVWHSNRWNRPGSDQLFRPIVYGWIGPLPAPNVANLKYKEIKYAIGTMTGREFDSFKAGVFNTLDEALDNFADSGDFVWEISEDGSKKAIAKWSNGKQKWIFRKRKKK